MNPMDNLERKVEEPGFFKVFNSQMKDLFWRRVPLKGFVIPGFLALMSKGYHGPMEKQVHDYVADTLCAFGMYHLGKSMGDTIGPKISNPYIATQVFISMSVFEVSQKLGAFKGQTWNPYDFITYALGASAALGLDYLVDRRKKNVK